MCGIIGYVGNQHPKEILLSGLKRLEYRGYDSSGIALKEGNTIQIIKSVGKIKDLEEKINENKLIDCNMGIAHTRWATHGGPVEKNAHPHKVGKVTLVHNGIIENASELKESMGNIVFNSETDTEVACALINHYYDGDPISAINKAISEIKGSYAFGILFEDKDNLYAVRKDSPLIIGIGEKENYIASDIAAIINYTNKYVLLEEGEIACLDKDNVIYFKNCNKISKEILTTNISIEDNDKCGYDHYMLKEIMEEPIVLERTLAPYVNDIHKLPDLSEYEEVHIIGCGSAMYAGMIGKSLLEEKAGIRVVCDVASEYRYKKIIYNKKTVAILISQSGETADTIAALRKAKENGVHTIAIVNVKTSTIARETDEQLYIEAGPEIAVATTKAYMLQVAMLSMLAYRACVAKDNCENENMKDLIIKLPALLSEVLNRRDEYLKIANELYNHNDVYFLGRKMDYSMCLEGSLKLKEVSYIHSEAYQAGELKHGTISLINDGTPVIGIITDPYIKDKTISNLEEVRSRGAKVFVVSNENIQQCDYNIVVPNISEFFQPLLIVPCLQLIGYETAKLRGCDIDKPRNLAKSVTVE